MLLVSMPQMQDPNFARTVVLLADYTPHGAFGLVLNRLMNEPAHEVVTTDEPLTINRELRLYVGGPVEPTRAWVLTATRELDGDAMEVSDGVYLSASPSLIRRTLELPPESGVRIVVGYAGWGSGSSTASWRTRPGCSRRCRRI